MGAVVSKFLPFSRAHLRPFKHFFHNGKFVLNVLILKLLRAIKQHLAIFLNCVIDAEMLEEDLIGK
jgi:hypothetical protein